ncbi:MAG TPA: hypothetical protein VF061_06395, partial [Gemmatimonadales bacterium]
MSRSSLTLVAITLSGVAALGCANDLTQPRFESVRQSADAIVVNQRTHVVDDATLFGTCTGEMFLVTGVIHERSAVTETATGITHQAIT